MDMGCYKGTTLSADERDALYGDGSGISFSMKPEQDWHAYRVEWGADGDVRLHLDENNTVAVPGLNNQGQTIESARLGAMGVDAATSGSISFDEFESRQHSLPGLLPEAGAADPEPPAIPSWLDASYSYDGAQAHAVTSVERQQPGGGSTTDVYEYDANGNMSCRIEGGVLYKHWYSSDNRLESIKQYAGSDCADPGTLQQTWSFTYDGDGTRVKEEYIVDGVVMYTRHLLGGGAYEFTDNGTDVTTRQYYGVEGMMVAMKEWVNEGSKTTNFFASDHLSSTSLVMDSSGNLLSENRYMPFGETRTISGTTNISETDFGYTSQRDYSGDFGLMDYRARFYSPTLGRFTQPDTIVPEPGNSQAWNRFSYVGNNPLNFNDPTGHAKNPEKEEDDTDYEKLLSYYGVTLDKNLSPRQKRNIYYAVRMTANAFARAIKHKYTAEEAFKKVYGYMEFTKCVEGGKNCMDSGQQVTAGAVTLSSHEIGLASDYINALVATNNIIHELGHAFNNILGGEPERMVNLWYNHDNLTGRKNKYYKLKRIPYKDEDFGFFRNKSPWTMAWEGSKGTGSEDFADMFIGWVWGNKFADNWAGRQRAIFMNTLMPYWIRIAMGE